MVVRRNCETAGCSGIAASGMPTCYRCISQKAQQFTPSGTQYSLRKCDGVLMSDEPWNVHAADAQQAAPKPSQHVETMKEGRKDDGFDGTKPMKPRWDLMCWRALSEVCDVITQGAQDYGDENWKRVPNHRARYSGALGRHFAAYMRGEKTDAKSGKHALAHVIACALFLLERDDEAA